MLITKSLENSTSVKDLGQFDYRIYNQWFLSLRDDPFYRNDDCDFKLSGIPESSDFHSDNCFVCLTYRDIIMRIKIRAEYFGIKFYFEMPIEEKDLVLDSSHIAYFKIGKKN